MANYPTKDMWMAFGPVRGGSKALGPNPKVRIFGHPKPTDPWGMAKAAPMALGGGSTTSLVQPPPRFKPKNFKNHFIFWIWPFGIALAIPQPTIPKDQTQKF